VLLEELRDFVAIPPHGGWSLLLDVSPLGLDGVTAAKRLLELGKIAATPRVHWGSANSGKYVRFVFANEPVHRLRGMGQRVKQALT
jgi:N-succinyldiaminopimelate aminotransferase